MSILGIVAEYNPFHNGHQYLIRHAVDMIGPSAVICVMSGNFTQRGEPAICNKWARAEMAIKGGADLVIELPFCYAVRSAYHFARGALLTLHLTGVTTHVAFGSESGDITPLFDIAQVLLKEPVQFKVLLKKFLASGLSFPTARSLALQEMLSTSAFSIDQLLRGPNNILAIEYLHVLLHEKLPLEPLTFSRKGSAYNDLRINAFASASAIRQAFLHKTSPADISSAMPVSSWDLMQREIAAGCAPVDPNSLGPYLLYKLRSMSVAELEKLYEVIEGLHNRIKEAASKCSDLEQMQQYIKTKRYSLTRINRILLYALFALSKNQVRLFDQIGPQYLHILGFSAKGQKILQSIKNKSPLPVLARGGAVAAIMRNSETPRAQMLALDILASDLFALLYPSAAQKPAGMDYRTPPFRMGD